MSIELLTSIQVLTLLGYAGTLFVVYRTWIQSKGALIELLKEQLAAAKALSAESLLIRLQQLSAAYVSEIERMQKDKDATEAELAAKVAELEKLGAGIAKLYSKSQEAKARFGFGRPTISHGVETPLPLRKD